MAKLPEIVVPHQPLHIMHRGNNRQDIFNSENDMLRIKGDIKQALEKSECSLHAYVIMTNRVTRLSSHGGDRKSEAYKKNQAD